MKDKAIVIDKNYRELVDLKIGEVSPHDIGQMNLYLNYFKKEENMEDSEPVGIVLAAKKNDIDVEFALGGISNKLFISKEIEGLLENGRCCND